MTTIITVARQTNGVKPVPPSPSWPVRIARARPSICANGCWPMCPKFHVKHIRPANTQGGWIPKPSHTAKNARIAVPPVNMKNARSIY